MTLDAHLDNARAWDQAAESYRKNVDKTVEFLKTGGVSMSAPEVPYLQDLGRWCRRAIHLQCAGGEDTLSLLNLGAKEVIGIDISAAMIDVAQQTSSRLGGNAHWIVSDVLEVPSELNESADLVYTGRGAINWVHDLKGWAQTVVRLLKHGGAFPSVSDRVRQFE